MSTSKKRKAGKRSGSVRAQRASSRRMNVLWSFENLKPTHQLQPFSNQSIDALEEAVNGAYKHDPDYDLKLDMISDDLRAVHRIVSRETLIKDLKALGIRSKLRKKRSG